VPDVTRESKSVDFKSALGEWPERKFYDAKWACGGKLPWGMDTHKKIATITNGAENE